MTRFVRNIIISVALLATAAGGFWVYRHYQSVKNSLVGANHDSPSFGVIRESPLQGQDEVKFAVMSDVHSDLVTFNKALAQAKNDNVAFVIITGDLTTVGESQEFTDIKKSLDGSGLKYYVVPGNHDHWLGRQTSSDLFTKVFGAKYQTFLDGQYKFILIDNGDEYKGLGLDQMAWVKTEVRDCPKLYCLVFMHEPLNHPNSSHIMGESTPSVATESGQLKKLLVDNKIIEIFAGHLHSSSHYEEEGLTTTITGAASTDRNWQTPRFVEVTLPITQVGTGRDLSAVKVEEKEVEIK